MAFHSWFGENIKEVADCYRCTWWIGGLFRTADVSFVASVFPVFMTATVKQRGSWRKTGVTSSAPWVLSTRGPTCLASQNAPSFFGLLPSPARRRTPARSLISVCASTRRQDSCQQLTISLSSALSVSSDVGCCARPCWEQRLPNLRGKPPSRYPHERRGGRVLQIWNHPRYRPEEPERWPAFRLHWIRGPEVKR